MKFRTKLHNFIINATIVCFILFIIDILCTLISLELSHFFIWINPTIFFISTIIIGTISVLGMIASILLSKS